MVVAGLAPRARPLPDGAENCAASTACASSAGVAGRDPPRLAACAASATISTAATQSSGATMPARSTAQPGISIPMVQAPGVDLVQVRHAAPLDMAQQHENEDDD